MVDSKIEENRGISMADSRHSQLSSAREPVGYNTSTLKAGNIDETSRTSNYGGMYQGASSIQYGSTSGLYSSTASSQQQGVSYTGQYGQTGSSAIYQSGTGIPSGNYNLASSNYQTNFTPSSNLTSGSSGYQTSSYQNIFKSGTGYTYQSGNIQQGGNSNIYKKPWVVMIWSFYNSHFYLIFVFQYKFIFILCGI